LVIVSYGIEHRIVDKDMTEKTWFIKIGLPLLSVKTGDYMKIIVLSDGETFDILENCTVVDVPEEHSKTTEDIEEYLRTQR